VKNRVLITTVCILARCATAEAEHSQWQKSIATDMNAGQIEYLDLDGVLMEWSAASKGTGWLYFSKPDTNDRVWSFPGRLPEGENKTGVSVRDGEVVTATHQSGRTFEIRIELQTEYFAKVLYREPRHDKPLAAAAVAGSDHARAERDKSAREVARAWFTSLMRGETAVTLSLSTVPFSFDGKMEVKALPELKMLYDRVVERKGKRDVKIAAVEVKNSSPQKVVVGIMIAEDDEEIAITVKAGPAFRVVGFRD